MSYLFYHYNAESNTFDASLKAPSFESFQSRSGARPARLGLPQTAAGSSSPPKHQPLPIPSSSTHESSWWSRPLDSSLPTNLPPIPETSLFPSSAWAPDVDVPSSHSVLGNALPPPSGGASFTDNDYAFLANIDPVLLATGFSEVVANQSASAMLSPQGDRLPSPSRKRPRIDFEEPQSSQYRSVDPARDAKRRRVSGNDYPNVDTVYPLTYTNNVNANNITSNTLDGFYVPTPSASTSYPTGNAMPQGHYPNPQNFYNESASVSFVNPLSVSSVASTHAMAETWAQVDSGVSYESAINVNDGHEWNFDPNTDRHVPLVNDIPSSSVTSFLPPVYSHETLAQQPLPQSSVYFDNASPLDYTNADSYNAVGPSDAFSWDQPSLLASYNATNEALGRWFTGPSNSDDFYSTIPVASSSAVVPPVLRQHMAYQTETDTRTNTVANDVTHSSVGDSRQHLTTTTKISTTGNVANATIPNAHLEVPSTLGAPSVDLLTITIDIIEPSTSSHLPPSTSRKTNVSKRKRTRDYKTEFLLDKTLWSYRYKAHSKENEFSCLYTGPDCPQGCQVVEAFSTDNKRNLLRHLRRHAKREAKMDHLSQVERVAVNALAAIGELRMETRCTLSEENLHLCKFFQNHGRRWIVSTMGRDDNLKRRHDESDHPPDLWKKQRMKV